MNTLTTTTTTTTTTGDAPAGIPTAGARTTSMQAPAGHSWEQAGDAWGRRAIDWACLFEHYATDTIHAIFDRLGAGAGSELLDVACGSGLALRFASARGMRTAGIDASTSLIEIARRRIPSADLRVGDMFALPWADASFDAVTSINGVWGGCEAALVEAHRVLRPGGRIAISFWGDGKPMDLRNCFVAFAKNAPGDHLAGMKRTNDISRPGVAEEMMATAGFEVLERVGLISTIEWPDPDTAWRALASVGPAVPALERVGEAVLRPIVLEALEGCRDDAGMYHFRNDHQFVVAEKQER